jgi:hypothetical protein
MAVVQATSTNGRMRTFSSTNATLATCLSDVMNALDANNVPMNQIKFVSFFDDTGQEFTLVAIQKLHS